MRWALFMVGACGSDPVQGLDGTGFTTDDLTPGGGGGGGGGGGTTVPPPPTDPGPTTSEPNATWTSSGTINVPAGRETVGGDLRVAWVEVVWHGGVGSVEYKTPWKAKSVGPMSSSTPFSFDMPDIPAADTLVAEDASPGLLFARFIPVAWVEKSGDDVPGPGDDLVASSYNHLLYIEGTVPPSMTVMGLDAGWNWVETTSDGTQTNTHLTGDLASMQVAGNLLPKVFDGSLDIEVVDALDVPTSGFYFADLFSLNFAVLGGDPAVPTLATVPVADSLAAQALSLEPGPPPFDHYAPGATFGLVGVELALYQVVVYLDRDGSETWNLVYDSRLGTSDADVRIGHIRFTGLDGWIAAEMFDGGGWTLYSEIPGGVDVLPTETVISIAGG